MSIIKEIRNEIVRTARREIKKELEPVKRVNAQQRKYIADLRRELSDMEKEIKRLQKELDKSEPEPRAAKGEDQRFWITGKGILSMRKRLTLTQVDFAKLAGVTQQTVVRWEKNEGKIPMRAEAVQVRLQELRSIGKREAFAQLEQK